MPIFEIYIILGWRFVWECDWRKFGINSKYKIKHRILSESYQRPSQCNINAKWVSYSIEDYMYATAILYSIVSHSTQHEWTSNETVLAKPIGYALYRSELIVYNFFRFNFFCELDEAFVECIERKVFRYNHFCIGKLFNILTFYRLHKWSIHPVHLCAVHN